VTVNFDGEVESGTARWFLSGQSVASSGPFDTSSGSRIAPHSLADDARGQNILAVDGGDAGSAALEFFDRMGVMLSQINTGAIFGTVSLGFATDDRSKSIAGVSILNADPGGIGVDNVGSDVVGVISPPPIAAAVPLPARAQMLGPGFIVLGEWRRLRPQA
jgi:hypothetical protein